MKAGWEVKKLDEVCDFRRGLTYAKSDEFGPEGIPVLRANNIDLENGILDFSDVKYVRPDLKIPAEKFVQDGSLLICTASGSKKHLGKTALVDADQHFAFGGFMGLLLPKTDILPEYLYLVTRSDSYRRFIDDLSDGTNINNLKFKDLSEFSFALPPLEEQKRIIAVLDEAFEGLDRARANAEANLADARELLSNTLNGDLEKLDCVETALGEHIDQLVGYAFKSAQFSEDPNDMRLLRGDNIVPKGTRWDDAKYWPQDRVNQYSRYLLKTDDVLIAMDRTWIKSGIKFAVVTETDVPSLLVQRVARLRSKEGILSGFLAALIGSRSFERYVLGMQTGTGVPHISGGQIAAFPVRVPSLSEQQRIIDMLDVMQAEGEKLISHYTDTLSDIDKLRQSLLQKAFSGALT